MPSTSIYSVANSGHFIGAIALVNSLRLTGHNNPIVVLDCGLTASQRELLAREVAIVPGVANMAPHLQKTTGPLDRPADIMLLIDADIIVTGSLQPLLATAGTGTVVAFADALANRFDERWAALLALPELRRQPYVSSGLVAFPRALGVDLLHALQELGSRIDPADSMVGRGTPSDPFYFLDQDVLNAYLASCVDRHALSVLPLRLVPHPPFRGVRIVDEERLQCAYVDGVEPLALHHIQRKPWLVSLPPNAYSALLPRLLTAPDLPLRLSPSEVPLQLREGLLGGLERQRAAGWAALTRSRRSLGLRRRHAPGTG